MLYSTDVCRTIYLTTGRGRHRSLGGNTSAKGTQGQTSACWVLCSAPATVQELWRKAVGYLKNAGLVLKGAVRVAGCVILVVGQNWVLFWKLQ